MHEKDVCAVILAGGKSSRMGCNKALLKIGGHPMIEIIIHRVRPITGRIIISSSGNAAHYQEFNYPVIPDLFKDHGPLAGLHAAMLWTPSPRYLVIACDLPRVRTEFLLALLRLSDDCDAVIPRTRDGMAHPLCAVYRNTCFSSIELALKKGANKVIKTFLSSPLSIRWMDPRDSGFDEDDLANVNTPEDLQQLNDAVDSEFQNNSTYSGPPGKHPDIL
jgi:molybdenum cofactor guanylyltransferase